MKKKKRSRNKILYNCPRFKGFFLDWWQHDVGRCRQLDQADVRIVEKILAFRGVGYAFLYPHYINVASKWKYLHTIHISSQEDFSQRIWFVGFTFIMKRYLKKSKITIHMIIQFNKFNLYHPETSSEKSQTHYSFLYWHRALKLLFSSLV